MKISIVVPAHNAGTFLESTLESVRRQTRSDWELIVVDDGSQDDTAGIAAAWAAGDPRFRLVRKPNGGVADARNAGFAAIGPETRYVAFLDHDDLWLPDTLQRLSDLLERGEEYRAAHGLARMTHLDGSPYGTPDGAIVSHERRRVDSGRIRNSRAGEPTEFETFLCDCCLPSPGVALIRREAVERIAEKNGGIVFDQSVAPADDWDFWLRLSLEGPLAYLNEEVLRWRQHGGNESRKTERTFSAEIAVRRKYAELAGLSPSRKQAAEWRYRRILASVQRRNAEQCWTWAREQLSAGDRSGFRRCFATWRVHYGEYLRIRLLRRANSDFQSPPARLTKPDDILNS